MVTIKNAKLVSRNMTKAVDATAPAIKARIAAIQPRTLPTMSAIAAMSKPLLRLLRNSPSPALQWSTIVLSLWQRVDKPEARAFRAPV